MTALTATAARTGDPTASMPSTMSKTPHKIDQVEACRTISDGVCCAIESLLKSDGESVLQGRQVRCADFWLIPLPGGCHTFHRSPSLLTISPEVTKTPTAETASKK
jgi:hypothetical protein